MTDKPLTGSFAEQRTRLLTVAAKMSESAYEVQKVAADVLVYGTRADRHQVRSLVDCADSLELMSESLRNVSTHLSVSTKE